jgi:hypothetical protein
MDEDIEALVQRWIIAFCEMPPLLDAELMRRVLAQSETQQQER